MKRMAINKELNEKNKKYYDYRKFSNSVLNAIAKQKT